MKSFRHVGFSLVEILVVLSIIAIGLTLSLPSWNDARSKRELINASEHLSMFLSAGRSLALKHNRDVAVSLVYRDHTDWCVGMVDTGLACDCTVEDAGRNDYCSVGGVPQILYANDLSGAVLISHAADSLFVFDRIRGTLIPADLSQPHFFNLMSTNRIMGLQVGVSITGNTFICNWVKSASAPAYRSCESVFGEPDTPAHEGNLHIN